MSVCTHDCSTCGESCGERKEVNVFEKKPLRPGCRVGKVYGVVSGKGGVGKSMVTSQLAVALRREGYRTAILDADITGPSIPKALGILGRDEYPVHLPQRGAERRRDGVGVRRRQGKRSRIARRGRGALKRGERARPLRQSGRPNRFRR